MLTNRDKLLSLAAELRIPPSEGRITAVIAEISAIIPRPSLANKALNEFYKGSMTLNEFSAAITDYAYRYMTPTE